MFGSPAGMALVRSSTSFSKILNFTASDTGLPISNVNLSISVPGLEKTITEVIATLNPLIKEVTDKMDAPMSFGFDHT
jgi:hypothetical protein